MLPTVLLVIAVLVGACLLAFRYLVLHTLVAQKIPPHVTFGGGNGSTPPSAITIRGASSSTYNQAQKAWLARRFFGCKISGQYLTGTRDRKYEVANVVTLLGKKHTVFFDITEFFGK